MGTRRTIVGVAVPKVRVPRAVAVAVRHLPAHLRAVGRDDGPRGLEPPCGWHGGNDGHVDGDRRLAGVPPAGVGVVPAKGGDGRGG